MIKEIIFDCFGVLTEDGWLAFVAKYGREEVAEELRYFNHQVDRGVLPYQDFLGQVCSLTNAPKDEAHTMITTSHHPNEQLFAYIRELKQSGYSLGVISNVGSPLTDFLPKQYVQLFNIITLSYEVAAIKPEPAIYEAHLHKGGYRPSEVVFIDDRIGNCEGAQAVGMMAIHYQNVTETRETLDRLLEDNN